MIIKTTKITHHTQEDNEGKTKPQHLRKGSGKKSKCNILTPIYRYTIKASLAVCSPDACVRSP